MLVSKFESHNITYMYIMMTNTIIMGTTIKVAIICANNDKSATIWVCNKMSGLKWEQQYERNHHSVTCFLNAQLMYVLEYFEVLVPFSHWKIALFLFKIDLCWFLHFSGLPFPYLRTKWKHKQWKSIFFQSYIMCTFVLQIIVCFRCKGKFRSFM